MQMRRTLIALALAALTLPPAVAAETDGDAGKSTAAPASGDGDRSARTEKRGDTRPGDDLVTCKRDADGMRGPERSRFMTRCLKERK